MSSLSIANFVTVSVAQPPAGLANYQVNNLAIFTKETPVNGAITATTPGVYLDPIAVLADWGAGSEAYAMANLIFGQSPMIVDGGGSLIISPMQSGDTLATDIPILYGQIFFGGCVWAGYAPADAEVIAAAVVCEPLRIKLFASSDSAASLTTTTGLFYIITTAKEQHTRCLLYIGAAPTPQAARYMAAAYAGRAMSVDFTGSKTTLTMQGKSLNGIVPDTAITQTILNTCSTLGVDTYGSYGQSGEYTGVVFSTGANGFFDDVYNLDWLVFALQIAGFNAIVQTDTKIPQTDAGMALLRGAYIAVLTQAVNNGYIAPGAWNSSSVFGSPVDLIRNILNIGWYIYSLPVNSQSEALRQQRKAPVIQIAIKLAGAVHSTSVVANINA